jgi:diamine N-acetyltransferase
MKEFMSIILAETGEWRGKGLGKMAIVFIEEEGRASGVERIELFVLRTNEVAVGMYMRSGFEVAAEVLTRLGDGAVLEDYVMRKVID